MGRYLEVPGADYSSIAIGKVTPVAGKVTINVVASPNNGGSVSGTGSYSVGSSVTISATPASGYKFDKWNDGNTNATRTIAVGETTATYTATFVDAKVYFTEMTQYTSIYGDQSTKKWVSGGQTCHVYPTLVKAGSVITFGGLESVSNITTRHGISNNAVPVVGESLSTARMANLTSFTTVADGYLYICTSNTSSPMWSEIGDLGYFIIQEPAD